MKKLTESQKRKVIKFAQKLVGKKILKEDIGFDTDTLYEASSNYFEVINQYVGNRNIKDKDLKDDIEATHTALGVLIGTLEDLMEE